MDAWDRGPDYLIETDSFTSTKLTDAVKIRNLSDRFNIDTLKPISVYSKIKEIVDKGPDHPALVACNNDNNVTYTYSQFWSLANQTAKSFIKLGLKLSSCVTLMGFNSPQWMFSFYGAIFAGGIPCGIYRVNTVELCRHILKDNESEIIVVESKQLLEKILQCRDTCNIKRIIQYRDEVENDYGGLVLSWKQFLECGSTTLNDELEKRVKTMAPNKCVSLVYTSGTTGYPKGVMLSHDNIFTTAMHLLTFAKIKLFHERIVSYLPLSHVSALLMDCFGTFFTGATLYFAEPDALEGSLGSTLARVKPTILTGIAKLWESMHEKLEDLLNNKSLLERSMFNVASIIAHKHIKNGFKKRLSCPLNYYLVDKFVLLKIKKRIGLDKCKFLHSGGEPIRKKTLQFFHSLGLPLCELFGMTETTAPHLISWPYKNRLTSVGNVNNKFNKTKLGENNELMVCGRNIFMGYLNNPEKTAQAFDADGWLHTGDTARIDKEGFVYITGRLKEILTTFDGQRIDPYLIEEALKDELKQLVKNCVIVGNNKKFLSALITLRSKENFETFEPDDELHEQMIHWLKERGSNVTTVSQVLACKEKVVFDEINEAIARVNSKALNDVAKVQKFIILKKDFSIANGEMGPSHKLRRLVILKKYADVIDSLYNEP